MSDGTVVQDDEDLMAAALAELRTDRADPPAAPAPAPADTPAPAPAPAVEANDAAAAPAASTEAAAPAADAAAKQDDPAEVLRRTQEELQKARSEMGRVGALNRALNDARAERDRLASENAGLKQGTKTTELSTAAAEKLAALDARAKEFPELAELLGSIRDALAAVDEKAANVAKQTAAQALEPLTEMRAEHNQRAQEQRAASYEAAMTTFQTTYPNAVEVVRSADFNAWIKTQPQPIQAAFYRGQDPGEAIAVMDAYDAALRRAGKEPIAKYPTATQTPAPAAAATQKDQNAARLKAAAGLPSRNSGAKGGMPPEDDFEASLNFFRQQRLAKAA